MIESPRKQIFEGAGAKDMELVTTRQAKKEDENRQYNQTTLFIRFQADKRKRFAESINNPRTSTY